ncbi:MAG: type IV secretion system DNA-binding domain-containing protein [Candidatus Portnoybacteria bacterium]|nr:type IV secretion system DNA-binding domain-containing protein [Candidatus Portnoybacteria bacterium]MDD4982435.1 type IV secretion system DNA-binding domain-containing protein [Candidatus Portnoybacteria bacterium]
MAEEYITTIGETDFRSQKRKFGIKNGDRQRHVYIVGKTGTGKTTLLENMAKQDIQAGKGLAIVDPHGDFAEKMIDFVPSNRVNDVIYFNPADMDFPIAFNVMEQVDSEHRHLVASGLIGVFKKIWAESWGPRLEYVLRNAVLALLEYPGATLLGIMRLLVDKEYRAKVMDKVKDPVVKSFWVDEFSKYKGNFEVEAISPIQNKVGQFLTNPLIRNIVGQTKSTIDPRKVMDEGKVLILNLSKGQVGEDASALLGAMMITKIQLAAMSRVNVPENERKDFYLYVDEFQNFATDSFANILSEARKYHLNLVLAHQYIGQLATDTSTRVRDAVFGNVGTIIVFRVGAEDAEFLEKEFSPEFVADDLVGLGFAQVYLKLMINGFSSRPFSATTLAPIERTEKSHREKIIKVSRERYGGLSRKEVEEKIARWSGFVEEESEEGEKRYSLPQTQGRASERPQLAKQPVSSLRQAGRIAGVAGGPIYVDKCFECGKRVELNFKPDGVRPVYCKDCLIKVRSQAPNPGAPKVDGLKKNISQSAPQRFGESQSFNERVRNESGPVIKETGPTISLSEATGRKMPEFAPRVEPARFAIKKPRTGPNLSELRSALNEVVGPAAPGAAPRGEKLYGDDKFYGVARSAEKMPEQKNQPASQGDMKDLKPGETAEL